jgi:hypothetical protein
MPASVKKAPAVPRSGPQVGSGRSIFPPGLFGGPGSWAPATSATRIGNYPVGHTQPRQRAAED